MLAKSKDNAVILNRVFMVFPLSIEFHDLKRTLNKTMQNSEKLSENFLVIDRVIYARFI
jgi:hypothetical protein